MDNLKTAADIVGEVNRLASSWYPRATAIRKWYNLIRLEDDLKQEKMESVISSDPRTGFNMASWLLTPRTPTFAADTDGWTEEQASKAAAVEDYCNREYLKELRRSRCTFWGRFDKRVVNLMLATGWYAVISYPTERGWIMAAWNPAMCYPEYSTEGELVRIGRKYTIPAREANLKVQQEGWTAPRTAFRVGDYVVTNLWWMEEHPFTGGMVAWFAATVGNHLASPPTPTYLHRIPVFTGPVAGLPDDGTITQNNAWRAEVGNAVIAPVAGIQKNYDKMLTYVQQLLRDTANPRWVEKVRGQSVLDAESLWKRGAIFSIEPGEDILPIPTPPLPPELRGHEFELRAQIQRGMFSDLSFGNVTQQVSAFLLTQVTAAAQQILEPFQLGFRSLMGQIATCNLATMRRMDWKLGDRSFPSLPDELHVDFRYDISIPGDFANRVSLARMLNPMFKLSTSTIIEQLIPEVKNALIEQGNIQAEDALANPVARSVLAIWQLQRAAQEARRNDDEQLSRMLERAAELLETQTFAQPTAPALPEGSRARAAATTTPPGLEELLAGRM